MPTGIRFPLGVPEKTGFGDTYEETRSRLDMEIGPARVRNRMRLAPRTFTVQWSFGFDEYLIYERWWQNVIKGTSKKFDIQLLDDTESIVWFTCEWIKPFVANLNASNVWVVTGTIRTISDSFETRPSGTDELAGTVSMGLTASAAMLIKKTLYGKASLGLTAQAKPKAIPLYGRARLGLDGRGKLIPRPFNGRAHLGISLAKAAPAKFGADELILQFDAITYTPPTGDVVVLQFDSTPYYPPHMP